MGGMPRLSVEEGLALFERQKLKRGSLLPLTEALSSLIASMDKDAVDPGLENELQHKINKWAKDREHPLLYFPRTPKVRAFLPPGWPDDILILPERRVEFFELKQKAGRVSDDQKKMKLIFMHHGHTIHEIRSYRRFLKIVEG